MLSKSVKLRGFRFCSALVYNAGTGRGVEEEER